MIVRRAASLGEYWRQATLHLRSFTIIAQPDITRLLMRLVIYKAQDIIPKRTIRPLRLRTGMALWTPLENGAP
jgi:hypothetical protein